MCLPIFLSYLPLPFLFPSILPFPFYIPYPFHVPLPSSSPSTFLFLFPFYLSLPLPLLPSLFFSFLFYHIYIFRSYCWIHGTAYIRPHLQGKATGCFVDQSKIDSPEVRASWPVSHQWNWVFVTNSDFLMPIFFQTQVRKQLDI